MTRIAAWLALGGPLFADAAAMTPNIFLGIVIGAAICWLRWRSPWRRK